MHLLRCLVFIMGSCFPNVSSIIQLTIIFVQWRAAFPCDIHVYKIHMLITFVDKASFTKSKRTLFLVILIRSCRVVLCAHGLENTTGFSNFRHISKCQTIEVFTNAPIQVINKTILLCFKGTRG
jgi:hypothetical protein